MPLGRNGLIGLAVAGTAGLGLIAIIIYREVRRKRSQRVALEAGRTSRLLDTAEVTALLRESHDSLGQGGHYCCCCCLHFHFHFDKSETNTLHPWSEAPRIKAE